MDRRGRLLQSTVLQEMAFKEKEVITMVEIEKGTKILVGDERKPAFERLVVEGVVREISEQEGVKYAYLNTGYYLAVIKEAR